MSTEVGRLWLRETRCISKLRSWRDWLSKMGLGFVFLGFLSFVTAAIAVHIHDNKSEATFGRAGVTSLFLAVIACFLIFLITSRLRRAVAALDWVEGTARAGFSEKGIESGCYLKIELDAGFPFSEFAGKWVWVGDEFQANHPDLVWACEKFGSGKKWHQDYKFPPEPEIKVETARKYHGQPVNLTLTFTTRRMATDPGRLLMKFGPFDSSIGAPLSMALRKRAEELLPDDLGKLRLDGSLADRLALSGALKLPSLIDLTQQNGEKSAPYRVEYAEVSDVRPSARPS